MDLWISIIGWFYFLYFLGISFYYSLLNIISFFEVRNFSGWEVIHDLPKSYSDYEIGISILVPAYNEEKTIIDSVRSLLQLDYPDYEVIVINDGSMDDTMEVMKREFRLEVFPEVIDEKLKFKSVKAVYRSNLYSNLKLIDKANGGKADSLNAGINCSRNPLFCCIDSDSILQRDSLKKVIQPFLEHPHTIAVGGTVRVVNGCQVEEGFLTKIGLPYHYLGLMQIIEYLRAFLFGRMGWSPLNAVMIISGAFGLFKKQAVIEVGGYRTNTIGEDMELVVRLHRYMRLNNQPYKISFIPNPICWTEAPTSFKVLKQQRVRWQRGLCEALWHNKQLLFHPKGGAVSWLAMPYMVFFEALEALVQVFGYLITFILFLLGKLSLETLFHFWLIVFGLGIFSSVNALILEELAYHMYPGFKSLVKLFISSILENIGFRQLNAYWRTIGFLKWLFRFKSHWGQMTRTGLKEVK